MLGLQRRFPLMVALALLPAMSVMHLRLVKASPNDGEVVTVPTHQIQLWFSQEPEVSLTTISLLRPDSSGVPIGKVTGGDSLSVKATIPAALPAGTYIVRWRTLSKDGHAVRGSYLFQQQNK